MAALNGALALAQVDHPPVLVAQDLKLDVPGRGDVFFHDRHRECQKTPPPHFARSEKDGGDSSAEGTIRIPRPPPPAAAFTMTG